MDWLNKKDAEHMFPKHHQFPFFCCAGWVKDAKTGRGGSGFWFRIFWGYGLHFTNAPKLFSERNGYEKRFPLPFGWRVKIIKKGGY